MKSKINIVIADEEEPSEDIIDEKTGKRSIFVNSKRSLDLIAKTNCICYSLNLDY